jgi:hypothetical protein
LIKTLKFGRKTHNDDTKLKKGLKHCGWIMGHGWGSHWKMGRWGQNIAPEMLHVSVGYVLGAQVA